MIISEIVLRDYKQFVGEHTVTPDRQGIIAVVGPNGAGKTTLFEAIEWCLYGPRSIANADVYPRGRESKPMVRITIEHPQNGENYVVERKLRTSRSMEAQVWRSDRPEEILATGSKPVRAFVSERLIGLGHDAFVSTFFTRQKELSFFGSMRPTERRVMVGRLIGVEAVRIAQEAIGLERSQAAERAKGLAEVVDQDSRGQNLDADIADAEEQAANAIALTAERDAAHVHARRKLEQAEAHMEQIRAREQRDREFASELGAVDATIAKRQAEHEGIERERIRLDAESARREELRPIAEDHDNRSATLEIWQREEDRQKQHSELSQRLQRARKDASTALDVCVGIVASGKSEFAPGWAWRDTTEPLDEIDRLLDLVPSLDVTGARRDAVQIGRAVDRVLEAERLQSEIRKYERRLSDLRLEIATASASGDPDQLIGNLEATLEEDRATITRLRAEIEQANSNSTQIKPLLDSLRRKQFGDRCPTCGQQIEPGDAVAVIATLSKQIDAWNDIVKQRKHLQGQITITSTATQESLGKEKDRKAKLNDLYKKQDQGQHLTHEKKLEYDRVSRDITELLVGLGLQTHPSAADAKRSTDRAETLGRISGDAQALTQRRSQLISIRETERELAEALRLLGTPVYDAVQHKAAQIAAEEANRAIQALLQIDRDLLQRPDLESRLQACLAALAGALEIHGELTSNRSTHAYQHTELISAREDVSLAAAAERARLNQLHMAQTQQRDRQLALRGMQQEKQRISALRDRSIVLRRQADELDRMYREFASFDQFVASRIAPRLAEETSELLAIATDNRYTQVAFDDNYGIDVFDGDDERFALEGFSGGERDIVALCARLALSQVIGSAAINPPSFLVLDEVFGALDRDRRMQLLDLLGQLAEGVEQFQQMFVISHVDDVRLSPIFSRVWRIEVTAEGNSRIEDVSLRSLPED